MALSSWAVGQRLTATSLQTFSDTIESYIPKTTIKTTATARTSTTTYAIDPDLQLIPLAVGSYEIELLGFVTFAATTASIKTHWVFTGTWAGTNGPDRACFGPNSTAAANAASASNFQGSQASGQDAIYNANNGVLFADFREISRNVQVTAPGTLALYWAQASNVASAVTLQGGSAFNVRKLFS